MASFFNVGGLVNPFSTAVGQRIEQATDATLVTENWALNMEICDLINSSSDSARDAMKAIRKRLSQNAGKNNQVIMYTLTVLETCVKNCGKAFHVLVAQKDFIQELVKLIGPKNDPPAVVQEKVLSLIQIWADAFKNQPDLNGVTQMYIELKNKGIEFPATDLDAVAPIYTPQRSVPEMQPQLVVQHNAVSPQHAGMAPTVGLPQNNGGSGGLSHEQTTKLQSELETVAHSMAILNEMLSELKPGLEELDDYALLNELTATCKEMQARIVDLIGRIQDDEMTAELLRLNDELNNLFLRHQRYEKNRSSSSATSPSAILGAAIGPPPSGAASAATSSGPAGAVGGPSENDLILIDLKSDKLQNSFSQIGITPKPNKDKDADDFDILAQSRTDSTNKTDLLKDIPSVDAAAGSIGSPYKRTDPTLVSKPAKERELDEMEEWLGSTKDIEGMEETLTSTEFDKFLEERAAAADNLPTITSTNSNSNASEHASQPASKKATKKPDEEDLLAL